MDRYFGWQDLIIGAPLCALVVSIFIYRALLVVENGVEAFFSMIGATLMFILFFMVWSIVSSVKPVACFLNMPNEYRHQEAILESGILHCESGFELRKGHRNSYYCMRDIIRECPKKENQ